MKRVLAMILIAAIALATAACGSQDQDTASAQTEQPSEEAVDNQDTPDTDESAASGDMVEVTFWHAMNGVNEEAMTKITDDFMAQNENIKVTLVNQGSYLDLFDKLMASARAEQLPTIAQIYSNRLSWYVSKDLVEDLTPYAEDPDIGFTQEEYDDIPAMFLDDGIWDDKLYALPFNKSQMVLYYNVDMFQENGVSVPATWDEWAEAAEKLTQDTDGDGDPDIYGVIFANNLSTDILPWFKQAGGTTMDRETGELKFDTTEAKEAIEFLNGMFQNGTARKAGEDGAANVPLQQGRAAMAVASTSALPTIESDTMEGITIDAAPLPGYKTDDQLYYGTNVTMFAQGTDAEKQAAWEYLKFLIDTENTAYFGAMTGYIPVRTSAQNDPVFAEAIASNPIKQLSFDCFDRGFQGERNIGSINALNALGDQLDLVFAGEKSVDEALADAQEAGTIAMEEALNS